jgi:hypothetical protein
MALSDDQKAMLRLLAQQEQGYEDIAALKGISVDEVRAEVKLALSQLEEEGVAPPPVPASPPPVKPPEETPAPAAAPKPSVEAKPESVATPKPPVEPEPVGPPKPPVEAKSQPTAAKAQPKTAGRTSPSRPKISLPAEKGPRAALAAGAAVVALLIVVLIVSGGDSDSGSDTTTAAPAATEAGADTTAAANSKGVTGAVLSAVDGSDARGVATFGRVKNSLALQIEAEGLEPTQKGDSYTVWLAQSPQKMLPLASTEVTKSGKIGAQLEVPTEVLAFLAKGTFDQLAITQTTDAALKASLAKATREKKSPVYTGTEVLRGTVTGPIVGAANKAK